jgi:hypothetical protein
LDRSGGKLAQKASRQREVILSSKNGWKKVRVVVELSVQGNYTDKDFSNDLDLVLNSAVARELLFRQLPRLRGLKSATNFKVASFNRTQAANAAKNPVHEQFSKMRQLITELSKRISQLEGSIDQPPRFDLAAQVAVLGVDSLLPPKRSGRVNNK